MLVVMFWAIAVVDYMRGKLSFSLAWKRVGEAQVISKEFATGSVMDSWKIRIEFKGVITTVEVSYMDYSRYQPSEKVKVKYSRGLLQKQFVIHNIL
jgi:hypothetical protein